jgi:Sulfotransferase domain
MAGKIREAINQILGRTPVQRAVEVYPDDVFLVSYPKSGNTWMRFLIGNLLRRGEPVSFADIDRVVPGTQRYPQTTFRSIPRPRVIKSHECFDPRYRRVIYVVRDPRDVAISFYHFERKQGRLDDSVPIENLIARFIGEAQEDYGTWKLHVLSWLANSHNIADFRQTTHDPASGNYLRGRPRNMALGASGHGRKFLLLRYKDLLSDTPYQLARVAKFMNLKVSPKEIARAVELSSADRLKKLEASQANVWSATRGTRKDIPFVRVAKSQQWRNVLPPSCIAQIETAWGPLMQSLGYQLSSQMNGDAAESASHLAEPQAFAQRAGRL